MMQWIYVHCPGSIVNSTVDKIAPPFGAFFNFSWLESSIANSASETFPAYRSRPALKFRVLQINWTYENKAPLYQ